MAVRLCELRRDERGFIKCSVSNDVCMACGTVYGDTRPFANKWEFEQMEILRFFLQLFREQMGISAVSYQMRLFFTILLQLVREQMEI